MVLDALSCFLRLILKHSEPKQEKKKHTGDPPLYFKDLVRFMFQILFCSLHVKLVV